MREALVESASASLYGQEYSTGYALLSPHHSAPIQHADAGSARHGPATMASRSGREGATAFATSLHAYSVIRERLPKSYRAKLFLAAFDGRPPDFYPADSSEDAGTRKPTLLASDGL